MRTLILEDNEAKAAAIVKVIETTCSSANCVIDRASSVLDGLEKLRLEKYDLLVLDLVLPLRPEQLSSAQHGKLVLTEIMEDQVNIPVHIVCVTAFENESSVLKESIDRNLVHLVIYDELNAIWDVGLKDKVDLIYRQVHHSNGENGQLRADIVLVTSSPLVELKEVMKLPGGFVAEYNRHDEIHYYRASWKQPNGAPISVVACAAPTMGMTAACVTTCKAIHRWKPRFVAMTGIAASTVSSQKLGDILCVETAYDYGSGKIAEGENGERVFLPSPQQIQLDSKVHAIVKHWERTQEGTTDIMNAWNGEEMGLPTLSVGVMASGAAVVQNIDMVEEIKNQSRKTVGVDMEAYAVFQACALAGANRPIAIVAKSVSDFADKNKGDSAQKYAAFTSARFMYMLFTESAELWL